MGVGAVLGRKTSSRIDPAQIQNVAKDSPIYRKAGDLTDWTRDPSEAEQQKGKPVPYKTGRPSEINHGNVPPSIDDRAGGVTVDCAVQTVVLSLAGLRRLRFPRDVSGQALTDDRRDAAEAAARTVLALLALAAVVHQAEAGYDLRSRCLLVPEAPLEFELLSGNGEAPRPFSLDRDRAGTLLTEALDEAAPHGFGWDCEAGQPVLTLTPAPKLADLIKRSRAIAATGGGAE